MISVFNLEKNEGFSTVSGNNNGHLHLGLFLLQMPPDPSTCISPSSGHDCCTWRPPNPFFFRNSIQPFSLAAFIRPFSAKLVLLLSASLRYDSSTLTVSKYRENCRPQIRPFPTIDFQRNKPRRLVNQMKIQSQHSKCLKFLPAGISEHIPGPSHGVLCTSLSLLPIIL